MHCVHSRYLTLQIAYMQISYCNSSRVTITHYMCCLNWHLHVKPHRHVPVGSSVALLDELQTVGCRRLIFSSSATVYGGSAVSPITESTPTGAGITNAYGRTKYVIEEMLRDFSGSPKGRSWGIVVLRYFNPVGAHPSGYIGEDPSGPPNNLMPYVAQVTLVRCGWMDSLQNLEVLCTTT